MCECSSFSTSSPVFIVCIFYFSHSSVGWYLLVVLVCIFLILMIRRIFSFADWPFVYLLWRNACLKPLPIFKLDYLPFFIELKKVLDMFWIQVLYPLFDLQKFSPISFFIFLMVLWITKVFHFNEVQFIFLLLLVIVISYLWSHCLIQGHKDFTPAFSSKCFIVLAFAFRPAFRFEFIL